MLVEEPADAPVDLIVVLDDSASMAYRRGETIGRARQALDSVLQSLAKLPRKLDIRLRVIPTTPDRVPPVAGCARAQRADCSPVPADGWFRSSRVCGIGSNFAGSLVNALGCAMNFRYAGCGIEQPLAALEAEVTGGSPPRSDADLFVLIISDADDCSFAAGMPPFAVDQLASSRDSSELTGSCRQADEAGTLDPLIHYAQLLDMLGQTGRAFLSVVAGTTDGSGGRACPGGAPVEPAHRLRRLVDALGSRGLFTDLCAADWTTAVMPLAEKVAIAQDPSCVTEALADLQPERPGLQPDCVARERPPYGDGIVLPPCAAGAPCWEIVEDASCSTGQRVRIDRGLCAPPAGTLTEVACAGATPM